MNQTTTRAVCLLIGYICGNFMTAEIVCRVLTGKSAAQTGDTGNPGMANVMAALGFKAGILVLLGDVCKCILAMYLGWLVGGPQLGKVAMLYAGTGAVIGHNLPVTLKFKGGKGVASTCILLIVFSPLWGILANIAGMLTVFATQYLCIGGVVIPAVFCIPAFLVFGTEAGVLSLILTAMMIWRHFSMLRKIPGGTCPKTNVLGAIAKKFGKNRQ